jgi:Na+/H+-dicarboxylate symporter
VIFFELAFTAIIPLIFFTIASSIASLEEQKTWKLFVVMIAVFLCTVLISAMLMIAGVCVSNSSRHYNFKMPLENIVAGDGGSQITQLLTNDFYELLSRKVCWL